MVMSGLLFGALEGGTPDPLPVFEDFASQFSVLEPQHESQCRPPRLCFHAGLTAANMPALNRDLTPAVGTRGPAKLIAVLLQYKVPRECVAGIGREIPIPHTRENGRAHV